MLSDALIPSAVRSATLLAVLCLLCATLPAQTYTIDTVAGGGMPPTPMPATAAAVAPTSAVTDPAGNVYFSASDGVFKMEPGGTLTRVAGAPGGGPLGDGGPATSAQLNHPRGLAFDSSGNLYIADSYNCRVRKVTPAGVISTVAGTGVQGNSGDGGPATSAMLGRPQGLALDSAGNLYIADTDNHRIRKITAAGTISAFAGTGAYGYAGDGGPAAAALLAYPSGVAADAAGNVYIADTSNNVVRKVTPAGTISNFAGTGTQGHSGDGGPAAAAQLNHPVALAFDSGGSLYVGGDAYVRKVTPGGTISTVAGVGIASYSGDGGPATAARLDSPTGVAADSGGNLYIADQGNARLRKVSPGGTITTVAGNGTRYAGEGGPAVSAQLAFLSGVTVDSSGNLYLADRDNARVLKVTPAGLISTLAGNGNQGTSGDGGPATSAELYRPIALAVDPAGNVYIGDDSSRVRKVTTGGMISTVAGDGTFGYSGDGGPATGARIKIPQSLALDPAGNLYIADFADARIRKVTPAGMISTAVGTGTEGYSGDGGPATSAKIHWPSGMAVDSAANLYFADRYNFRIRRVDPAGTISTVAGSGLYGNSGDGGPATSASFGTLMGVAVDPAGNLFLADQDNLRIRKVASGIISTVAGSGSPGHSGDGGPATAAQFELPNSLASDAEGRIYVADGNGRALVLIPSTAPSCSYAVSTDDLLLSGSGGQVKIAVHTDPGCAWSLSGLPAWLTASGTTSGTGSAEITLNATAAGATTRAASLSVGEVAVPVYQCNVSSSCARRVLPHVAFGSVWTTGLFAINTGTSSASFSVSFYGDDGAALSLPLPGGTSNTLVDSVPAQGMMYYEITNPGQRDSGGWGVVNGDPSIIVQGLFRNQSGDGKFYEGAAASSGGYSRFIVPFDATTFAAAQQPFYTGFAIANVNQNATAHVTCVARDQTGATIPAAMTVPPLAPLGHYAEFNFPALTAKRGTLDCSADTLVSALALRIIGTAAFSSLPVLVR